MPQTGHSALLCRTLEVALSLHFSILLALGENQKLMSATEKAVSLPEASLLVGPVPCFDWKCTVW